MVRCRGKVERLRLDVGCRAWGEGEGARMGTGFTGFDDDVAGDHLDVFVAQ